LHPVFYLIIKSYLSNRHFQIRFGNAHSTISSISVGVPQGGILSPVVYNIYAADQPTTLNTLVADYADDKAIISINSNPEIASHNLLIHLTLMEGWYTKWRFKINQSKSIHTTFKLCLSPCPEVSIYGTQISISSIVKYLGLTLDCRFTWVPYLSSKRKNLNLRLRLLKTLQQQQIHTH